MVHRHGNSPEVHVINISDTHVVLKQGTELASALPAEIVSPMPDEVSDVFQTLTSQQDIEVTPGDMPPHLQTLYQQSIEHLSDDEALLLKALLIEFEDVFAKDEFDLGNFTEVEHNIDTQDSKPIKQRMRKTPVGFAEEEEAHLNKMLKTNVIRPSNSDWASAPVLVRKRDGSVRWCVDWRALNAVTVKDQYPLPLVDECVDMLAGNVWFSKLDANSAYWQVRLKPEDCKKTAFTTKYGLFEFVRMGFGLCNAPATFARGHEPCPERNDVEGSLVIFGRYPCSWKILPGAS